MKMKKPFEPVLILFFVLYCFSVLNESGLNYNQFSNPGEDCKFIPLSAKNTIYSEESDEYRVAGIYAGVGHQPSHNQEQRLYLIIILILLFVFGGLVYYDIRSKTMANKELASINSALEEQQQKLEKTLEVLQKSENKYKTLIHNSPTGILLTSRDGQILEGNKRIKEILGLNEISHDNFVSLFECEPIKQSGLVQDIEKTITTGETVQSQRIIKAPNGEPVHANVIVIPLKTSRNKVSELILNFEDITFSRKAQKIIHESEEKYRILVENSLQAMLIIQDGRVIFTNQRQKELTQYSFDDLKKAGRGWLKLIIHPDDLKRSLANVNETLEGERIMVKNEYRIIRKDGKVRWIETQGSIVNYHENPALLMVANDITGRKESELFLIETGEKLRQVNAMKDKFFSIIAHDLKNPFNAIMGFSNLLNEAYNEITEEQRREFIRNICDASENTFKLLQNLLDWSRTQTGNIECNPVKMNLALIAEEAITVLITSAWNKGVQIQQEIPHDAFAIADDNMIKTIFRNLISNAIKFSKPGGKVSISAHESDGEVVVCFQDEGIGISKKNLERLFRIDEQFKSTGTANEGGSGLGLILCKEFIEMNHGRIWAESSEGKGSKFYFSMPKDYL